MTAAVVAFFWILSMSFCFWAGLKLGQQISQRDFDDFEV